MVFGFPLLGEEVFPPLPEGRLGGVGGVVCYKKTTTLSGGRLML